MSHKSGTTAIQPDSLTCLHGLLDDDHNSISGAQNKAVQRWQQLSCIKQSSTAFQLSAYACLSASNTRATSLALQQFSVKD